MNHFSQTHSKMNTERELLHPCHYLLKLIFMQISIHVICVTHKPLRRKWPYTMKSHRNSYVSVVDTDMRIHHDVVKH
ncbi:hypothetical protein T10_5041 [Trichinella papuae]|uniref:Uncharacterized protein n=1 Tax=Trichinella papuae TaxID=268474 RepID=A0A0V1MF26_9BILA|nr:hypothetical protein T10_5041 [Trichinella papuae]